MAAPPAHTTGQVDGQSTPTKATIYSTTTTKCSRRMPLMRQLLASLLFIQLAASCNGRQHQQQQQQQQRTPEAETSQLEGHLLPKVWLARAQSSITTDAPTLQTNVTTTAHTSSGFKASKQGSSNGGAGGWQMGGQSMTIDDEPIVINSVHSNQYQQQQQYQSAPKRPPQPVASARWPPQVRPGGGSAHHLPPRPPSMSSSSSPPYHRIGAGGGSSGLVWSSHESNREQPSSSAAAQEARIGLVQHQHQNQYSSSAAAAAAAANQNQPSQEFESQIGWNAQRLSSSSSSASARWPSPIRQQQAAAQPTMPDASATSGANNKQHASHQPSRDFHAAPYALVSQHQPSQPAQIVQPTSATSSAAGTSWAHMGAESVAGVAGADSYSLTAPHQHFQAGSTSLIRDTSELQASTNMIADDNGPLLAASEQQQGEGLAAGAHSPNNYQHHQQQTLWMQSVRDNHHGQLRSRSNLSLANSWSAARVAADGNGSGAELQTTAGVVPVGGAALLFDGHMKAKTGPSPASHSLVAAYEQQQQQVKSVRNEPPTPSELAVPTDAAAAATTTTQPDSMSNFSRRNSKFTRQSVEATTPISLTTTNGAGQRDAAPTVTSNHHAPASVVATRPLQPLNGGAKATSEEPATGNGHILVLNETDLSILGQKFEIDDQSSATSSSSSSGGSRQTAAPATGQAAATTTTTTTTTTMAADRREAVDSSHQFATIGGAQKKNDANHSGLTNRTLATATTSSTSTSTPTTTAIDGGQLLYNNNHSSKRVAPRRPAVAAGAASKSGRRLFANDPSTATLARQQSAGDGPSSMKSVGSANQASSTGAGQVAAGGLQQGTSNRGWSRLLPSLVQRTLGSVLRRLTGGQSPAQQQVVQVPQQQQQQQQQQSAMHVASALLSPYANSNAAPSFSSASSSSSLNSFLSSALSAAAAAAAAASATKHQTNMLGAASSLDQIDAGGGVHQAPPLRQHANKKIIDSFIDLPVSERRSGQSAAVDRRSNEVELIADAESQSLKAEPRTTSDTSAAATGSKLAAKAKAAMGKATRKRSSKTTSDWKRANLAAAAEEDEDGTAGSLNRDDESLTKDSSESSDDASEQQAAAAAGDYSADKAHQLNARSSPAAGANRGRAEPLVQGVSSYGVIDGNDEPELEKLDTAKQSAPPASSSSPPSSSSLTDDYDEDNNGENGNENSSTGSSSDAAGGESLEAADSNLVEDRLYNIAHDLGELADDWSSERTGADGASRAPEADERGAAGDETEQLFFYAPQSNLLAPAVAANSPRGLDLIDSTATAAWRRPAWPIRPRNPPLAAHRRPPLDSATFEPDSGDADDSVDPAAAPMRPRPSANRRRRPSLSSSSSAPHRRRPSPNWSPAESVHDDNAFQHHRRHHNAGHGHHGEQPPSSRLPAIRPVSLDETKPFTRRPAASASGGSSSSSGGTSFAMRPLSIFAAPNVDMSGDGQGSSSAMMSPMSSSINVMDLDPSMTRLAHNKLIVAKFKPKRMKQRIATSTSTTTTTSSPLAESREGASGSSTAAPQSNILRRSSLAAASSTAASSTTSTTTTTTSTPNGNSRTATTTTRKPASLEASSSSSGGGSSLVSAILGSQSITSHHINDVINRWTRFATSSGSSKPIEARIEAHSGSSEPTSSENGSAHSSAGSPTHDTSDTSIGNNDNTNLRLVPGPQSSPFAGSGLAGRLSAPPTVRPLGSVGTGGSSAGAATTSTPAASSASSLPETPQQPNSQQYSGNKNDKFNFSLMSMNNRERINPLLFPVEHHQRPTNNNSNSNSVQSNKKPANFRNKFSTTTTVKPSTAGNNQKPVVASGSSANSSTSSTTARPSLTSSRQTGQRNETGSLAATSPLNPSGSSKPPMRQQNTRRPTLSTPSSAATPTRLTATTNADEQEAIGQTLRNQHIVVAGVHQQNHPNKPHKPALSESDRLRNQYHSLIGKNSSLDGRVSAAVTGASSPPAGVAGWSSTVEHLSGHITLVSSNLLAGDESSGFVGGAAGSSKAPALNAANSGRVEEAARDANRYVTVVGGGGGSSSIQQTTDRRHNGGDSGEHSDNDDEDHSIVIMSDNHHQLSRRPAHGGGAPMFPMTRPHGGAQRYSPSGSMAPQQQALSSSSSSKLPASHLSPLNPAQIAKKYLEELVNGSRIRPSSIVGRTTAEPPLTYEKRAGNQQQTHSANYVRSDETPSAVGGSSEQSSGSHKQTEANTTTTNETNGLPQLEPAGVIFSTNHSPPTTSETNNDGSISSTDNELGPIRRPSHSSSSFVGGSLSASSLLASRANGSPPDASSPMGTKLDDKAQELLFDIFDRDPSYSSGLLSGPFAAKLKGNKTNNSASDLLKKAYYQLSPQQKTASASNLSTATSSTTEAPSAGPTESSVDRLAKVTLVSLNPLSPEETQSSQASRPTTEAIQEPSSSHSDLPVYSELGARGDLVDTANLGDSMDTNNRVSMRKNQAKIQAILMSIEKKNTSHSASSPPSKNDDDPLGQEQELSSTTSSPSSTSSTSRPPSEPPAEDSSSPLETTRFYAPLDLTSTTLAAFQSDSLAGGRYPNIETVGGSRQKINRPGSMDWSGEYSPFANYRTSTSTTPMPQTTSKLTERPYGGPEEDDQEETSRPMKQPTSFKNRISGAGSAYDHRPHRRPASERRPAPPSSIELTLADTSGGGDSSLGAEMEPSSSSMDGRPLSSDDTRRPPIDRDANEAAAAVSDAEAGSNAAAVSAAIDNDGSLVSELNSPHYPEPPHLSYPQNRPLRPVIVRRRPKPPSRRPAAPSAGHSPSVHRITIDASGHNPMDPHQRPPPKRRRKPSKRPTIVAESITVGTGMQFETEPGTGRPAGNPGNMSTLAVEDEPSDNQAARLPVRLKPALIYRPGGPQQAGTIGLIRKRPAYVRLPPDNIRIHDNYNNYNNNTRPENTRRPSGGGGSSGPLAPVSIILPMETVMKHKHQDIRTRPLTIMDPATELPLPSGNDSMSRVDSSTGGNSAPTRITLTRTPETTIMHNKMVVTYKPGRPLPGSVVSLGLGSLNPAVSSSPYQSTSPVDDHSVDPTTSATTTTAFMATAASSLAATTTQLPMDLDIISANGSILRPQLGSGNGGDTHLVSIEQQQALQPTTTRRPPVTITLDPVPPPSTTTTQLDTTGTSTTPAGYPAASGSIHRPIIVINGNFFDPADNSSSAIGSSSSHDSNQRPTSSGGATNAGQQHRPYKPSSQGNTLVEAGSMSVVAQASHGYNSTRPWYPSVTPASNNRHNVSGGGNPFGGGGDGSPDFGISSNQTVDAIVGPEMPTFGGIPSSSNGFSSSSSSSASGSYQNHQHQQSQQHMGMPYLGQGGSLANGGSRPSSNGYKWRLRRKPGNSTSGSHSSSSLFSSSSSGSYHDHTPASSVSSPVRRPGLLGTGQRLFSFSSVLGAYDKVAIFLARIRTFLISLMVMFLPPLALAASVVNAMSS